MEILEQAIKEARELSLYEDSEKADEKSEDILDALWQSIYDVCQLVNFGIIEEVEKEELEEATTWLKKYQQYTEHYQEKELPF